jgi:hypothetical protein
MKDARFCWGMGLTVVWIGGGAALLYARRADLAGMSPNEWGDFFAGCFSPIALLWLVLGYLQQGEELKLNTKALHDQAKELRESVAQQQALVEVTNRQFDAEREARQYQRLMEARSAMPHFRVRTGKGMNRDGDRFGYTLWIKNIGAQVSGVQAIFRHDTDVRTRVLDVGLFEPGHEHESTWLLSAPLKADEEARLHITYNDRTNNAGEVQFVVRAVDASNPKRGITFSQILEQEAEVGES